MRAECIFLICFGVVCMKNHVFAYTDDTDNYVSWFNDIPTNPTVVEVFARIKEFQEDLHPLKVNLAMGSYQTDDGKPWILPVVHEVELSMVNDVKRTFEYINTFGMEKFTMAATRLILGVNSSAFREKRAFGIQGISGTGALRLATDFLARVVLGGNARKIAYVSDPTYENHHRLLSMGGFNDIRKYRYWNAERRTVDIDGLLEDLGNAPQRSVIMLQASAHNPTGTDPTQEQWKRIAAVMKERHLFPLFDAAYQGFATGDLDADGWSVRYFASEGFELLCAQSFAKNFGLYNQRVGNLAVVTTNQSAILNLRTQLGPIIRGSYSSPPAHGAQIVSAVLHDPELTLRWRAHIVTMSDRLKNMRRLLREKLEALQAPGTWRHFTDQIGMFAYSGLTKNQVAYLAKKHHVYLLSNSRLSVCGLTTKNVDHVARAITDSILVVHD